MTQQIGLSLRTITRHFGAINAARLWISLDQTLESLEHLNIFDWAQPIRTFNVGSKKQGVRLAMYLCARLASCSGESHAQAGFHGRDIVIRALSETGFVADARFDMEPGAIVRLRLPGAGNVLARIREDANEFLSAEFVNPLGPARLRMVLGMGGSANRAV
jgi:hypothetical protein